MDGCSWDDIRLFLSVAEHGSFSAAARALEIGQATASRRIANLERDLGVSLFNRSVDGVMLTNEGVTMRRSARLMEEGALAFDMSAKGKVADVQGRVRFTSPPGVAVWLIAPFAASFRRQHAGVRLESLSTLSQLDLARGEADLALRSEEPREPSLLKVASAFTKVSVFLSETVCRHLRGPVSIHDLNWIGWTSHLRGMSTERWLCKHHSSYQPVFMADSFVVQIEAMRAGIGALLLPDVQAAQIDGIERVEVIPEEAALLPYIQFYLVATKTLWRVPRVRHVAFSFLDWFEREAGIAMTRHVE